MKKLLWVTVVLVLGILAPAAQAKVVHRWSFSENPNDSVGGANATLREGARVAEGKLQLDGQGAYAELPIGRTLSQLSKITVEGWVIWPEQQGAWTRFFDFGTGQNANMFFTPRNGRVSAGGEIDRPRFAITAGGLQQEQQLNSPDAFPVGEQAHFAVTLDGDAKVGKMYINGRLVATNSDMSLKPSNLGTTNNNYLGASQYFENDPPLRGTITEFRIYDTALSESEIAQSAKLGPDELDPQSAQPNADAGITQNAAPTPAAGGLVHRYSFTDDANDSVGTAHATLAEGAKIENGRLILDGVRAHAALPIGTTIEKLSNASVETWVKWDERQRPWLRLFDFGARAGKSMYVTPRNGGGRRGTPRNTLRFTITVAGDPGEQQANATEEFPVGEDTHVVMTLDADKDVAKLYVNGKLMATQEGVTLTPSELGNTSNNWIGRSQFPDPFFKGSFDEFRIYNKALTPEEVEANFKAGPEKAPQ